MLKRLVFSIVVAFFSTFLCFVLLYFSKGSIAYTNGVNSQSKEFVQRIEQNLGLDKPLLEQYKIWLFKALKGDLGVSFLSGESVLKLIKERIFNTFILGFNALMLLFLLSVFLALLGYYYKESFIDKIITFLAFNFFALPPFVLALLFVLIFGIFWKILPVMGSSDIGFEDDFLNRLEHLILPVLVLVLSHLALFLRIARNFINESFSQIFIQNLYARALREKDIYFLVLKYSLSPIVAYFGGSALSFMMGTYVVESVFAYEGLGSLLFKSIIFKDYPVVLALIFFSVLLAAFFTFLSDIVARILNPRLRRLDFV
ncbi:ABC transporter permease [Campylobacter jejuni]|uniref:Peptide ABC transporter, permease protein n=1 Tax=Campylobacter jejuni subsp. jejuni serotype O:23/36 (strain 81-176) TaxID=354242 RepID=A0A0H3PA87_CAMJJ|nr:MULTISPECIES: ABC transporter permease [Campylobacter]ETJ82215.1 peptide ABC transporter permease [Campylobacter jejuni subsp. jejuni 81-176-DRH212]ETN90336.1 peptide ABC transporter permease [Campylobacter jejuni subsp. jejuni 81-176-UMCW9]ALF92568.1 nickel ABC transporter, permease protein [Campylobacter jejuni subsp. jejuni]ALF94207.1 nickel ABC transporter, permease protein [Campylobacter jejuni subsp. jejuni]ANS24621.1 nickel ABC transporter, permease protein [Campylobacter jejuni subs